MKTETRLRRDAIRIFRASLEAAGPARAIARAVTRSSEMLHVGGRSYRLDQFERVIVLGAGKASAAMAHALERILGSRISAGLINTKYGHLATLKRIQLNECGHPVPDGAGIEGARRIAALAEGCGARDLVFCLISGGASALTPMPAPGITLEQKQATTKALLACGATIQEINAVRKHISGIKGGQLGRLAAPATVISLMLSDVIGDSLDVIGSGPTVPDFSTFASAWAVIGKYGIASQIPGSVAERFRLGMAGQIAETPKAGDACFRKTQNLIVGSNRLAVDAAARKAEELGYKPVVLSTFIEGETREIAAMHTAIAREVQVSGHPAKPPVCLISGGETTVTIRGNGLGGRNQEFALAAALALDGLAGVIAFSGGTDGTDGPTDAAGAIADGATAERAHALGLNPAAALAANDSYHFFEALGDLVKTGPTGTNVMDIRLLLVGKPLK
ncbi:MAG TPA: glycerate kinase [Bryobacteraceae bacterium]|nr:glycerate kinase [Bryobacteraceae bacterium]